VAGQERDALSTKQDAVVENAIHRCSDNQTHLCSILIKADGRFTRSAVAWRETLPRESSTGRLRIIDVVSHKQVRAARHQEFRFSQGITDHDPLRKDRRSRLGQLTTGTSESAGRGNGRPFAGPPEGAIPPGAEEERIEAGKVPHFVAALANPPLASCSGKNVLGEPLTSQRATLTSPCAY